MAPRSAPSSISFFRWTLTGQAGWGTLRIGARLVSTPSPDGIRAVITDFGGVLTNRLIDAFAAFQDETGISMEQLGRGMQRVAERDGEYPLFTLERGEVTEQEFLDSLAWALETELGHRPTLHGFREIYFEALHANEPMLGADARAERTRLPDGDPHQQRARVGGAVAREAPGRRDLRAGRRLRLGRHAQARSRHLRADDRAARTTPLAVAVPVRRRQRGQRRGGPRARHDGRALPVERAGDPRDQGTRWG